VGPSFGAFAVRAGREGRRAAFGSRSSALCPGVCTRRPLGTGGGLDPVNADIIDALVQRLDQELGVTSIMVTHDVRGAFRVANRLALLSEGKVVMQGTPQEFLASEHPKVKAFLERDFDNSQFAA
jgi:ABC-type histidine transport system ATPase subunit